MKLSKRCRYCDNPIKSTNKSLPEALQDICEDVECKDKRKIACDILLECGHPCYGIKNDKCLPCLNETCSENNPDLKGTTGDDYCNICFVEGLSAAPCV